MGDPGEVVVRREDEPNFGEYAQVSIAFVVRERLVPPAPGATTGDALLTTPVRPSYVKDYDGMPGEHPVTWPARFDVERWGVFAAWQGGVRVGGAVVAWGTVGLDMLDGRTELAVLWDIRVAPDARGQGVGRALLHSAERWASSRGARELKVETQDVNVAACRFYARHGFALRAVTPGAYVGLPHEAQLLWYKTISVG